MFCQNVIHLVIVYLHIIPRGSIDMEKPYEEKWIGLEDIALHLDVNKDTIRNWIKNTDIPAHKVGRQLKFKRSEIDKWVKSGKSSMRNIGDE